MSESPSFDDPFGDLLQDFTAPPPSPVVTVGPQWVTNRNWKELLIPAPKPIWPDYEPEWPFSTGTVFDIETDRKSVV